MHSLVVISNLGINLQFSTVFRAATIVTRSCHGLGQDGDIRVRRKFAHEPSVLRTHGRPDRSVANSFMSQVHQVYGQGARCVDYYFAAIAIESHTVAHSREAWRNLCGALVSWRCLSVSNRS